MSVPVGKEVGRFTQVWGVHRLLGSGSLLTPDRMSYDTVLDENRGGTPSPLRSDYGSGGDGRTGERGRVKRSKSKRVCERKEESVGRTEEVGGRSWGTSKGRRVGCQGDRPFRPSGDPGIRYFTVPPSTETRNSGDGCPYLFRCVMSPKLLPLSTFSLSFPSRSVLVPVGGYTFELRPHGAPLLPLRHLTPLVPCPSLLCVHKGSPVS